MGTCIWTNDWNRYPTRNLWNLIRGKFNLTEGANSSLWGYSHFFPPIAPFKNRSAPQGNTPLAAARGLAALHPARRAAAN